MKNHLFQKFYYFETIILSQIINLEKKYYMFKLVNIVL
jgi:hypothetical protein